MKKVKKENALVNTIIGRGTLLEGDLEIKGLLRVDGSVVGSLLVDGPIVIGSEGRVEADIRASSAIIAGLVKGDVYVTESLLILSGAAVIGNIFSPIFEAQENTLIHGQLAIIGKRSDAEAELKTFVRKHGKAKYLIEKTNETSIDEIELKKRAAV